MVKLQIVLAIPLSKWNLCCGVLKSRLAFSSCCFIFLCLFTLVISLSLCSYCFYFAGFLGFFLGFFSSLFLCVLPCRIIWSYVIFSVSEITVIISVKTNLFSKTLKTGCCGKLKKNVLGSSIGRLKENSYQFYFY